MFVRERRHRARRESVDVVIFGLVTLGAAALVTLIAIAVNVIVVQSLFADPPGQVRSDGSVPTGLYLVGKDLTPGTYETSGAFDPEDVTCYWARLRSLQGPGAARIEHKLSRTGGQHVTILPSDYAFHTSGCRPWRKVD
jgi:hypothetical protein